MILVVCTDDPGLIAIARECTRLNQPVYGQTHQIFRGQLPALGQNENLFIIAHGAFRGDGNNPVIGDEQEAFYVNGVELYVNLSPIIPPNYRGRVYIDACESATNNAYTFSFSEVFKSQIQPNRNPAPRVFGRNGTVGGLIPLPDANGWREA